MSLPRSPAGSLPTSTGDGTHRSPLTAAHNPNDNPPEGFSPTSNLPRPSIGSHPVPPTVDEKSSPTRKMPRLQAVVRRIGSTFSVKAPQPPKSERGEKDFLKAFLKKFDADEVEVLRKVYKELSARNPGTGIDKATFLQYFTLPGLWGERLFQRFDYKCLGAVDYEEFLVGIAVCCRGTKCERIHVLFQVFDLNGDGVLQKDELVTMLSNLPNLDRYVQQPAKFRAPVGPDMKISRLQPAISPQRLSRSGSTVKPVKDEFRGVEEIADLNQNLDSVNIPEANLAVEYDDDDDGDYEDDEDGDYDSEDEGEDSLGSEGESYIKSVDDEYMMTPFDTAAAAAAAANYSSNDDTATLTCAADPILKATVDPLARHLQPPSSQPFSPSGAMNLTERYLRAGTSAFLAVSEKSGEMSDIPQSNEGDTNVHNIDVEAFVDRIIEECEYSESDSLTFIEFKTWIEKNDSILAMFNDCLHEDAWGLQGNALYRRTDVDNTARDGGRFPSRRFNLVRDSRGVERRKRTVVDLRPDAFYKVKRLFTDPARSKLNLLNAEAAQRHQDGSSHPMSSIFVRKGPGRSTDISPVSYQEEATMLDEMATTAATDTIEIYPRQTRDMLNLQLLDLIVASHPNIDVKRFHQSAPDPLSGGEPLCCPSCSSLLVVCPRCNRRFPQLRLSHGAVIAECRCCLEGKVQQFRNCWHCNWSFAQAVEHVDHCEPLCEGRLYKIGRHMHKWRKRYFVLVDNLLYYYNRKDDTRPRGFIFLEGCFVEPMRRSSDNTKDAVLSSTSGDSIYPPVAKVAVATSSTSARKFGFSIMHGGGKIPRRDLYATSEKERQLWVDSLRNAMNQQDIAKVYQIGEVLGQGKFSIVHRAIKRDINEQVAIKIIDKGKIDGHEAELLRCEIAILRLLRHPHVISFREILDTRRNIHIVMEYVAGGELYDLLQQKRRLPELHVNRIVFQLLTTVAYLHKCGIIHRDLKPENILLTNNTVDADIKITDFGLSCICGPDDLVTQPCGTLAYVAPEVLTLQGYHHKVDVWSVGVIMYLLLRGRLPFPVGRPVSASQSDSHYYRPLNFDGPVWSNVCSSAKDLLKKLLQPQPQKRISAQDALQHIWIKNPTAVINEGAAEIDGGTIVRCSSTDNILRLRRSDLAPYNKPLCPIAQPELIDVSAATFSMEAPARNLAIQSNTTQNVSHINGAQIPLH